MQKGKSIMETSFKWQNCSQKNKTCPQMIPMMNEEDEINEFKYKTNIRNQ